MAYLELNEISKKYGGVVALDQATLHCTAGEVHGLVGENGAGKSTLVKILSGAVQRDTGEIFLDGQSLHFHSPKDAINAGIGMVYQEFSLLPDLTVGQNIFIGREETDVFGGTSRRTLHERCYELFRRMGIDAVDPDRKISELPLLQRQIIEIAKVVAREPRVVIFDEATSALPYAQAEWLLDFIPQLAETGKTIIYISHNLAEVRRVSERITVFRDGRDVGTRARDEASTEELVDLILGREFERLYPQRTSSMSREPMLEVHHFHVAPRLQEVSFTLHKGEILGIAGLEGQGQEELFHGLFGIRPGHGELKLEGKPITVRNPDDALRQDMGLALVPEDRATQGLLLPKSVSNNISLSILPRLLKLGLINQSAEQTLVQRLIEQFSIKVSHPADPVHQLSGGNQQKVVLAKLLATRPKVLMLYDSTRGVDVGTKAEIFALLQEITEAGGSVLMYSTEFEELINMCNRVLVIRQGFVEVELTDTLITEENIVRASMGEPIVDGRTTNDSAMQPSNGRGME